MGCSKSYWMLKNQQLLGEGSFTKVLKLECHLVFSKVAALCSCQRKSHLTVEKNRNRLIKVLFIWKKLFLELFSTCLLSLKVMWVLGWPFLGFFPVVSLTVPWTSICSYSLTRTSPLVKNCFKLTPKCNFTFFGSDEESILYFVTMKLSICRFLSTSESSGHFSRL